MQSKIVNRYKYIKLKCKGKTVLDLGCVDHDFLYWKNKNSEYTDSLYKGKKPIHRWLHDEIIGVAKKVVGVDYQKKDVDDMIKAGYNVIQANVETMDLGEKYDVIVAGEIIEHVQNPGLMLQACKKHMHDESILIITTPNSFYYFLQIQILLYGKPRIHPEHTCMFDIQTLSYLCSLNGLNIISKDYTQLSKPWHRAVSFFTYRRKNRSQGIILTLKK